jgi:hypothetical protein
MAFSTVFNGIDTERFLAGLLVNSTAEIVAEYVLLGLDPDSQQAIKDVAQRVFSYPEGLQALQQFAESVFYDLDGRRLVCRAVEVEQGTTSHLYLLVVLTPADIAYKRALGKLVRHIQTMA